jgi:hypothetical protein
MEKADKQDLQHRLSHFSHGEEMFMKINRIEADYLQDLVNEDWRK